MLELQYRHPIRGCCVNRYFKTMKGLYNHIEKYHSPISYFVSDLDNHDISYYGFYDPINKLFVEDFD